MKTMAQALIERRYVQQGRTTRVVVLPLPDSGMPQELVEAGQPVPLDLLSGRPVNLELDEQGLEANLCFAGPPVRCSFPWEAVIAAQDLSDELVQTLVVTVAAVMEDGSLRPTEGEPPSDEAPEQASGQPRGVPSMALLDGKGQAASAPEPPQKPRPQLQLVSSEKAGGESESL